MPRFTVKALSSSGEIVEARVDADNREAAWAKVKRTGVVPVKVEALSDTATTKIGFAPLFGERRPGHRETLAFTRELATLLEAGIALDRVLDKLAGLQPSPGLRKVLRGVSADVKSGSSLSAAMARAPDVFPPFYTGLVNAGEAGGTLPSVLGDIAAIIHARQVLSEKIAASLLYPVIVLLMIAASFVILMAWVVPEFRPLLESQGSNIPMSAAVVLLLSGLVVDWGWAIAILGAAGVLLAIRIVKSQPGRRSIDRGMLGLPKIGPVLRGFEAARYCRALGTLLSNGVTLSTAVGLAGNVVENTAVSTALSRTAAGLARGRRLAQVLRAARVMPPLVMEIVDVGEESGNLGDMLILAADTAQSEAEASLQKLVVAIAPLVTILLGAFVAVIIGTILSAMLSTYDVPL